MKPQTHASASLHNNSKMVMASSFVSRLESKGLNDSPEISSLVANAPNHSDDASFRGGTIGAFSAKNQLSNQADQISISS